MAGKNYLWMFLIYALIPVFGAFLHQKVKQYNIILRLLFYVFLILLVEFFAGLGLEQILGECPWKYDEGFHIMGFVRLDYAPAWMLFAFIVEFWYRFLDKRLI